MKILNGVRWVLRGRGGTAAAMQTLLTRLLVLAMNLVTGMITARVLGPTGRGEQAAMILWPQFLAYLLTLGLPSALLYNLKRHPQEESQLFSSAVFLGSGLGVLASLTGILFIPRWLDQYSPEVIYFAQWFMISAPLTLLSAIFTAALEADSDFTTANHVRYLVPLITLISLGTLALTHTLTPFTAGLSYLVPSLPVFFWMLAHLWKRFHPRWAGLAKSCKQLISYGLRSSGIDLLGALSSQVDQVLVVGLLSPANLGLYVVALSVSRMLNVFQTSIVTVLFPKAAARPIAEVIALIGQATRISTALSLLAAIVVMLLGPVLLHLLYGAEYMAAVPVFRILIMEVIIDGTTWVLAQAFMALGRPGMVTILQGAGLGLTVPLLLLLIPAYGLEGAGLALLLSTTIRLVLVLFSYPFILKVRPPSLIINKHDWHFLKQILPQRNL